MNIHENYYPLYFIGVDTVDKNHLTYTLARRTGKTVDILLMKTSDDEQAFKEEVNNLSKYFEAVVLEEESDRIKHKLF